MHFILYASGRRDKLPELVITVAVAIAIEWVLVADFVAIIVASLLPPQVHHNSQLDRPVALE
jgi:hypothetical protein